MKNYLKKYPILLFLTLTIFLLSSKKTYAQFTIATDNANDSAYSTDFSSGQNGGNGYTAWTITNGANTGTFTGDPLNDGMSNTDIGTNAFSFYATGGDYLNAMRGFDALELNDELTFYWSMNFDASSGSKGFDLRNSGTSIFNVNNASSAEITTTNGTATSDYGTNAMLVTVKRILGDNYEFSMTSKSGGATYTTTFNSSVTIDEINIYIGNQNDAAGERNIYFNNFEINNDANFNITTGTETYSKDFTGSGSLNKMGSGILVLSGDHSYTGTTTVDEGTLILNGNLTNSDVTVMSGATLEINGTSTVKSINVEAGGYIQINSGVVLTLTNDLTLNSTSTFYSTLISNGTIIGTVNYKRYVNGAAGTGTTTGANDLISPPLSGSTFGVLRNDVDTDILSGNINGEGPFYLFGPFDTASNGYNLFSSANDSEVFTAGNAYRSGSNGGNTYTFTGAVESGTVTKSIIAPTASIWNLIGNPYPSYMKVEEFLQDNLTQFNTSSAAVYGYDGTASDGWITWNLAYALDPVNSEVRLTPGQGFFVASKPDGGLVSFDPSYRTIGDSDDFIAGRSSNSITNLELTLTSSTSLFVTDIYFTEFSTQGLDPGFDSSLYGASAPDFALYSQLVMDDIGIPMAIQSLAETDYGTVTIPLGVNSNQGEQITFNITANTLPATTEVYLDDNVTNTSTLLTAGDYVITPSTDLSGIGRFYLRFTDITLSIAQNDLDNLKVYSNKSDNTLVVSGTLLENTTATIFDIQGRMVNSSILQSQNGLQKIDVSHLTKGVYVVQLNNSKQSKNQKVILN